LTKAYINGTGCISPQNSIDSEWFFDTINPAKGDYFDAIEPSYKEFIAPNLLRRMGRAIKMGVAAGNIAIQQADAKKVDAIITGTDILTAANVIKVKNDNQQGLIRKLEFIRLKHQQAIREAVDKEDMTKIRAAMEEDSFTSMLM
jgi:hypothetical protein